MSKDCLFCRIAEGDIPSKEVYSDKEFYAFRDINPQAPVHILIVPRKHIATINDLQTQDAELIGKLLLLAKKLAAQEAVETEGYRIVLNCNRGAGQSVFHIHLHLLGGRAFSWPPG